MAVRPLLAALVFAVLPVTTGAARELTADEQAALSRTIADFDAAMANRDMVAVAQAVPPAILDYVAKDAGISVADLKAAMQQQIEASMALVTLESYGMDLAGAEHRELADGTPYLVIATTTVIGMGEAGRTKATSPTLAFMDEGVWYLMRIGDSQQLGILQAVYPEFAGVQFPASTTEPVTE